MLLHLPLCALRWMWVEHACSTYFRYRWRSFACNFLSFQNNLYSPSSLHSIIQKDVHYVYTSFLVRYLCLGSNIFFGLENIRFRKSNYDNLMANGCVTHVHIYVWNIMKIILYSQIYLNEFFVNYSIYFFQKNNTLILTLND